MAIARVLTAQDIAGAWQGTLSSELGTFRTVLDIVRVDSVRWRAVLFSVDQSGFEHGVAASGMTFGDSSFAIRFDTIEGTFSGVVRADGTSIRGTWLQNNEPVPLTLWRATNETLWRDPLVRTAAAIETPTTPDFAALWSSACGAMRVPDADTGVVFGRVAYLSRVERDTSDYVQAAWSGKPAADDSSAEYRPTVSRAHVKDDGSYAICGVPVPQNVSLRVVHEGLAAPVLSARVGESRVVQRTLTVASAAEAAALDTAAASGRAGDGATIVGTVVDADRRRVAGARVHVRGLVAPGTTTDASGRFILEGVPAGERAVEIAAADRAPMIVVADSYDGDTVSFVAKLGDVAVAERAAGDARSLIHGVATDSARRPMAGVEVYVVSSGRTTRTDQAGRFRLDSLIEGPTTLRARRIDWSPVDTTVVLAPQTDVTLNFRFLSRVSALDTIRVTASRAACKPRDFEGFECRRKSGLGIFIDPARVDSINPRYIGDLFDGVVGFRRVGKAVLPTEGDRCVTTLINGHPPMRIEAMALAQMDARDVVAVEAYTDPRTYPEWYKMYSWTGEGGFKAKQCALIVLWTEGPPAKP